MLSLTLFETFTSVGYFLKRVFQTHKTRSIVAYSYTYIPINKNISVARFEGRLRSSRFFQILRMKCDRMTLNRGRLHESGLSYNPDRTHSVSVETIGD